MKQYVVIYTDGACAGNPGPGGWAAIIKYDGSKEELHGGEKYTTNNRMEMTAVIEALKHLGDGDYEVDLCSDSSYIINGLSKGWAKKWSENDWIKSDTKPVKNPDLWKELLELTSKFKMHYHWVKGHAQNQYNNRCDELAVMESKKFIQKRDGLIPISFLFLFILFREIIRQITDKEGIQMRRSRLLIKLRRK